VVDTALPEPSQTQNKDGTITRISWKINDDGKKVKLTQRIRITTHKEVVNPRVAERKSWSKFGLSAKDAPGPATDTTSVGGAYSTKPLFFSVSLIPCQRTSYSDQVRTGERMQRRRRLKLEA
jgi:hypothetical protein